MTKEKVREDKKSNFFVSWCQWHI